MGWRWPSIIDVTKAREPGADHAIYLLIDITAEPAQVRYVGKSKDPAARYIEHLRLKGTHAYPVNRWAKALAAAGTPPRLVVVEWAADWEQAERKWIVGIRAEGYDLLNVSNGGLEMKHVIATNKKYPIYTWALRHCGAQNQKNFKRPANTEAVAALKQAAERARAVAGEEGMRDLEEHLLRGLYDVSPLRAFILDVRSWER